MHEKSRICDSFLRYSNMKNSLKKIKQAGFTLMELLVVIAIIMILATLIFGGMKWANARQAKEKCTAQIKMLETALEEYKLDNGNYPVANDSSSSMGGGGSGKKTGSQVLFKYLYYDGYNAIKSGVQSKIYLPELDPMSLKQGWTKAMNEQAIDENITINDPWGQEFRYRSDKTENGTQNQDCINAGFDLWSFGPDAQGGDEKTDRDNITNRN